MHSLLKVYNILPLKTEDSNATYFLAYCQYYAHIHTVDVKDLRVKLQSHCFSLLDWMGQLAVSLKNQKQSKKII